MFGGGNPFGGNSGGGNPFGGSGNLFGGGGFGGGNPSMGGNGNGGNNGGDGNGTDNDELLDLIAQSPFGRLLDIPGFEVDSPDDIFGNVGGGENPFGEGGAGGGAPMGNPWANWNPLEDGNPFVEGDEPDVSFPGGGAPSGGGESPFPGGGAPSGGGESPFPGGGAPSGGESPFPGGGAPSNPGGENPSSQPITVGDDEGGYLVGDGEGNWYLSEDDAVSDDDSLLYSGGDSSTGEAVGMEGSYLLKDAEGTWYVSEDETIDDGDMPLSEEAISPSEGENPFGGNPFESDSSADSDMEQSAVGSNLSALTAASNNTDGDSSSDSSDTNMPEFEGLPFEFTVEVEGEFPDEISVGENPFGEGENPFGGGGNPFGEGENPFGGGNPFTGEELAVNIGDAYLVKNAEESWYLSSDDMVSEDDQLLLSGSNPIGGGSGNPFAGGENPFAGGENPFAGGGNPFAGGENPFAGS